MAKQLISRNLLFCDNIGNKNRGHAPYSLFLFTLTFFLPATSLFSQAKYDNIWVIGHGGEGTTFDFSSDTLSISANDINMYHHAANASICDSTGLLLFYTNGVLIASSDTEMMPNGNGLNFGALAPSQGYGVNIPQIILAMPLPGSDRYYYLLYKALTVDINGMNPESHFYYAVIDMALNNGLGEVIEKNTLIFEGVYLDWGEMTACKHANGRDWWILQGESDSNIYYKFLFTPDGILLKGEQAIGIDVPSGLGQAAFSPDGTKYARLNMIDYDLGNFIDIYGFDRCEGVLSNHIQINYADTAFAGGLAFSPNSRFLYVSSTNYLYQYDTWEPNIPSSKQIVGIYDGFQSPFWASFYLCQLAPDNKIYINAPNGVDVMHVINHPNEKGMACDFKQHSIQLPTYNGFSMPNFPYFKLRALEGSPCDTIGVSAVVETILPQEIKLSPNPASNFTKIKLPDNIQAAMFNLLTSTGQLVLSQHLSASWSVVPLDALAPGLYFYEVKDEGRILGSGKLVKVE